MPIARIQIDCSMLEGEELADLLMTIGDMLVPLLDPHEEDEPCVRFVQIEAYQFTDDAYQISFSPEEEEELIGIGVPAIFRDNYGNN